jgi:hypothetical protein
MMSLKCRMKGGSMYCVRVCESVSPRCSPAAKQVWHHNLWVCGDLIESRESPNRASSLGFIWTHYSQETPKSSQGKELEMDKVSKYSV